MTAQEILSAAGGAELGRKPVFNACCSCNADFVVDSIGAPGKATLKSILNPFDSELYAALKQDPEAGNRLLEAKSLAIKSEIESAWNEGYDGILYEIRGADAGTSTPMQYGGILLEVDRDILSSVRADKLSLAWILGAEPFLDIVSDLPCTILAFHAESADELVSELRQLRSGWIAANSTEADVRLSLVCECGSQCSCSEGELTHAS